jgi:hypothetical protein
MENVFWNLEWDYEAYKKGEYSNSPYVQDDWNQTLVTRINQISAQIHTTCLRGPADTIYLNSYLEPIFETLGYYWSRHKILSDRYKIVIDDTLENNLIYIVNKKTLSGPIYLPSTTKNEVIKDEEDEKITELGDVSFSPAEEFTQEEVDLFITKLKGIITIQNYNPLL